MQEGDVVVDSIRVVVRVTDDLFYFQRQLVGVGALLALTTQIHDHALGTDAAEDRREAEVSGPAAVSSTPFSTEVSSSYSLHEAVGCAQHPLVVDEGASTAVNPGDVQTGLPGPAALGGGLSSNDPAVDLRSTTHCGETGKASLSRSLPSLDQHFKYQNLHILLLISNLRLQAAAVVLPSSCERDSEKRKTKRYLKIADCSSASLRRPVLISLSSTSSKSKQVIFVLPP